MPPAAAAILSRCRSPAEVAARIGRLEPGLASRVGQVVGVEISPRMAALARARCEGLRNAGIVLCDAAALSFADGSSDLDSFPYFVMTGDAAADGAFAEAARVLRACGDLVVFNFSYRGDPARDRADIARLAATAGFEVVRSGIGGLAWWDGLAFHLHRGEG